MLRQGSLSTNAACRCSYSWVDGREGSEGCARSCYASYAAHDTPPHVEQDASCAVQPAACLPAPGVVCALAQPRQLQQRRARHHKTRYQLLYMLLATLPEGKQAWMYMNVRLSQGAASQQATNQQVSVAGLGCAA